MKFLLAGGGTAGHVNPLLATADHLADLGHQIEVVGTKEGLESRLEVFTGGRRNRRACESALGYCRSFGRFRTPD